MKVNIKGKCFRPDEGYTRLRRISFAPATAGKKPSIHLHDSPLHIAAFRWKLKPSVHLHISPLHIAAFRWKPTTKGAQGGAE